MKSAALLREFAAYCKANPELRFWQALCGWAQVGRVLVQDGITNTQDTFYWEERIPSHRGVGR